MGDRQPPVASTVYEGKIENIQATSYRHTSLDANTTYYYVVSAYNGVRISEVSAIVSATTPSPNIVTTPSSDNFGNVYVSTTSPAHTFTVNNTGAANLVIGTLTITGSNPSDFLKQSDGCSGQTLSPSASCTVQVVFAPSSAGTKGAYLSIPSNDPDTPTLNVSLNGVGIAPNITITPSSDSFGTVYVNTTSPAHTFNISNTGTADLIVGTITLTGADQSEFAKQSDGCSGQTLSPSVSCTVQVAFAPTSTGAKVANLSIPSNDPDTPTFNVSINGVGTYPAISITKVGTGFGTVTSSPAGVSCGTSCSSSFIIGTVVALAATPDSNSTFGGWSGGGCTGTGICSVTMNVDTNVTATFNYKPPVADFTATPTSGEEPMLVNFTDQSQYTTSWQWNFGDGTTSSLQNPSHIYRTPGAYSIALTATGPGGSAALTKTDYITVIICPPNSTVRILRTPLTYYSSIYDAYIAASDGDTIQAQERTYLESLSLYKTITIDGGYTCDYSNKIGRTTLKGQVNINSGTVTIKDVVIDK